jgi:hypothetical protein
MSDSLENYLFGPLDKKYCLLFYIFSVITFLGFILVVVGVGASLVNGFKFTLFHVFVTAYALFISFIAYLTQRLLYSMCVGSLKE